MEVFNSSLNLVYMRQNCRDGYECLFAGSNAQNSKKKRHQEHHAVTAIELTQRISDAARGV